VTQVDDHSELSAVIGGLDQCMVEWELLHGERVVRLSLSCQARQHAPVVLDVGPVMALADLLAWKVAALVGRARERDYQPSASPKRGEKTVRPAGPPGAADAV
jgi:hypothetical protein